MSKHNTNNNNNIFSDSDNLNNNNHSDYDDNNESSNQSINSGINQSPEYFKKKKKINNSINNNQQQIVNNINNTNHINYNNNMIGIEDSSANIGGGEIDSNPEPNLNTNNNNNQDNGKSKKKNKKIKDKITPIHFATDNIIGEGRDRFYVIKQFHSDIFSQFYPNEIMFCISKEDYLENVVKKANNYNKFSIKFKIIHFINIAMALILHGINFFLLFYFDAEIPLFTIILIPTFLFLLSTWIINLIQIRSAKKNSKKIENYFEKLHLKYPGLTFITLFHEDHNRKYIFGELRVNLKEIIIDYPYIDINNVAGPSEKHIPNTEQNSNPNTDVGNIIIDIDSIGSVTNNNTRNNNNNNNNTKEVLIDQTFLEI